MNPYKLIRKYYKKDTLAYNILITHSENVAEKALWLAGRVKKEKPDKKFLIEAAMLHDIGIFMTDAPNIGCFGEEPYIRHGVLGAKLVRKAGHPQHALVCERHTGVGISRKDIKKQKLPLPDRDFLPVSLEEQIVCFADKFYSKNPKKLDQEKSLDKIHKKMEKFGGEKAAQLESWIALFDL